MSAVCQIGSRSPTLFWSESVKEADGRRVSLVEQFEDERSRLRAYAYEHGIDSPEVTGWEWLDRTVST